MSPQPGGEFGRREKDGLDHMDHADLGAGWALELGARLSAKTSETPSPPWGLLRDGDKT